MGSILDYVQITDLVKSLETNLAAISQTQRILQSQWASQSDWIARHGNLLAHRSAIASIASEASRIREFANAYNAQNSAAVELYKNIERSGISGALREIEKSVSSLSLWGLEDSRTFQAIREFKSSGISEMLRGMETLASIARPYEQQFEQFRLAREGFQNLITSISTPWIDVINASASFRAMNNLTTIGNALKLSPPFGTDLTQGLRSALGDWRDVTIPGQIYEDLLARSEFYRGLGFDPELTGVPSEAAEEALDASSATVESILSHRGRQHLSIQINIEVPDGFPAWMESSYRLLTGFESRLRAFVDQTMRQVFGENWIKHQVQGEVVNKWRERLARDQQAGNVIQPLLHYADFSEYVEIICRSDNWRSAFSPFFVRKESVRESFTRLFPVRNSTMHARPLTQEDFLLAYVEIRRILRAIEN